MFSDGWSVLVFDPVTIAPRMSLSQGQKHNAENKIIEIWFVFPSCILYKKLYTSSTDIVIITYPNRLTLV